jgi:transposase InsO family protein
MVFLSDVLLEEAVWESAGAGDVAPGSRETGQPEKRVPLAAGKRDQCPPQEECENRLNREFQAERAGAKWASDITCLRTLIGWIYLTAALDLFDRDAIGWAFSADLETVHTTLPALRMDFARRAAQDGLVSHFDRRSRYCSKSFRDALSFYCPTVRQSMR